MGGKSARQRIRSPAPAQLYTPGLQKPPLGTAGPQQLTKFNEASTKKKSKLQCTDNTECQVCLNIALPAHPKGEADFCPVMDSQQTLPALGPQQG